MCPAVLLGAEFGIRNQELFRATSQYLVAFVGRGSIVEYGASVGLINLFVAVTASIQLANWMKL
jgi:hypothetical protein